MTSLPSTRRRRPAGLTSFLLAVFCCGCIVVDADAEEQAMRIIKAHRKLIRWIGFSPDGESLTTASFDGSLQIRDAASGELRKSLTGHRGQVFWGSYSNNGQTFVSGGEDAVLRLWNLDTGQTQVGLHGHKAAAWTGMVTPDGARIVSGGPDSMVFIWDVATGRADRSFRHSSPVWWVDVSHDSRTAAIAAGDGKVTLYDLNSGNAQRTFGDHRGGAYCVKFSPDDRLIATAGADGQSKLWNTQTGALQHTLPQFGAVHAVVFSPDGKQLATGGADYSVRLWNVDQGAFQAKRTGHVDAVWTIAYSPKGSQLASAGGDGDVRIWGVDDESLTAPRGLPARIDLRPILRRLRLPVIAQRARNTCSVHTFTRALEFAVSKRENRGIRLSDEYLNWACNQVIGNTGPNATDRGQFFENLWMGYCKHGICAAGLMPFQQKFDPSALPSGLALKSAEDMRQYAFVWRDVSGPGIPDAVVVSQAKAVLARGWPLLAGSSHSLFVVGYVDGPDGGLFLVGDSGAGKFIDHVTEDRLHSAIPYSRVKDYGFSWIECSPSRPTKPSP